MGYYPPNTKVSELPLRPVMDQQQMFRANLQRGSQAVGVDRGDAYVMWRLTQARARAKNRKDWLAARRVVLATVDLVVVRKAGDTVLRWAK